MLDIVWLLGDCVSVGYCLGDCFLHSYLFMLPSIQDQIINLESTIVLGVTEYS